MAAGGRGSRGPCAFPCRALSGDVNGGQLGTGVQQVGSRVPVTDVRHLRISCVSPEEIPAPSCESSDSLPRRSEVETARCQSMWPPAPNSTARAAEHQTFVATVPEARGPRSRRQSVWWPARALLPARRRRAPPRVLSWPCLHVCLERQRALPALARQGVNPAAGPLPMASSDANRLPKAPPADTTHGGRGGLQHGNSRGS